MWKVPAPILCLVALPLLGCAGDFAARQAAALPPAPVADAAPHYPAAPHISAVGPTTPVAVLVFLPGDDVVPRDPELWEAQGFDVVMPQPTDLYRLVAGQQADLARLVASAEALADTPIWLVGPSQAIEAAMAQLGGGVSGVVVTSVASPIASCSESFSYFNPGTGAPPQVQVRRSGDCGAGLPGMTGRQPPVLQPPAAPRPNAPRIIEASNPPSGLSRAARVRELAEVIKAVPPG